MKKLISIFILLIINIFIFTGCTHSESSVSLPPDEMARLQSVSVMECFENEDIEGLKSMFCNEISYSHDLEQEITEAFDYIKGKIISYDEPDGTVGGKTIKHGETTKLEFMGNVKNIKIDENEGVVYSLYFNSYVVHQEDASKVGVTNIRIFLKDELLCEIGEIVR